MKQDSATNDRKPEGAERLSSAVENYLLSLYILKEEQERTVLGQLAAYIRRLPAAEGLGTSLPTVLGMLRRMSRDGLIQISAQKEIQFTQKGAKLAATIARRHRLAERLVVDVLGVSLPDADQEAHILEHGISPFLEEKINETVGNPTTCPFGKPIPGSGYKKPPGPVVPMNDAKFGVTYLVSSLPDEDPKLVEFLCEHRVLPDEEIEILEIGDYRDVITFRTPVGETALSFATASRIYLTQRPPEEVPQSAVE
ncbi:MAG: metal-dependent transcriptional regulator [Dehalococcoidia bacterium]|nr:metal-dependent transcriptional regulator [Chloroflexota bacterium]